MTLSIRRFQPSDAAAVTALHERALAATGALAPPGPHDADLASIERHYLDGRGEFLVGEREGALVAMGALRAFGPDTAELKRMRVAPEHQGRGWGRAMLLALEARAIALGYARIVLDTSTRQTAAIALYERHGYTRTAEGRHLGMDALYYAKTLMTPAQSAT